MRRSQPRTCTLRFLGAAGTVTGSRFLLEIGSRHFLVDCGLYQGLKDLRLRNWQPWPSKLERLQACMVTHAHIDHSGYLPRLYKLGYKGLTYCSPGTGALLPILLPDAAHLQEEAAEYANRKGFSKHHPALPLYDTRDATTVLTRLRTVEFRRWVDLDEDVSFSLYPAGHLLGSASVLVRWGRGAARRTLLVSGDLGKYGDAFMADPKPPGDSIDYLIMESTYGDREHPTRNVMPELARVVNDTCQAGGVLVVPAFAVGRTQELLFYLARLEDNGEIPVLDVYVDSPMAIDATDIYRSFPHERNFDWSEDGRPLLTKKTHFVHTPTESRRLNELRGNAIILSASGMATGGRVVHHLANRVGNPQDTIMFAGYQVEGTRGRKLVDGATTIRMHGHDFDVKARIINFRGFSAHGDRSELLRWAGSLAGSPRKTFVVHGEHRASAALCQLLVERLGHRAEAAKLGQAVRLA